MKLYLIAIQLLLLVSCKSLAQYELKLPSTYNGHKVIYRLSIPEKYSLDRKKGQNAEVQEIENLAHLKDGSTVYITNDLKAGGGVSDYKIIKYGTHYELNNYIINDTATLYGNVNGKYWKERKYYVIIVGYYNVSYDKIAEYDKILNGIVVQVDKIRRSGLETHKTSDISK